MAVRSESPRVALALLRASHLQPTVAVTAFSTALALGAGRRWRSSSVASAVLAGQLCVGWSNDVLDRDRDRRAGRSDKPIVVGEVSARTVGTAALAAGAACVPLSLLSGRRAAAVHALAVASALAYNGGLKSTVASVAPYAVAFGALPAFVALGSDQGSWPSSSTMGAAALLGAGAHFVNTLPDLDDDTATGVRGLPHRLGPTRSLVVGAALLGGAAAVVAHAGRGSAGRAGVGLTVAAGTSVLAVVGAALTGRERLAWSMSLGTAALTVASALVSGRVSGPATVCSTA
jgi:4-hydroxybenzoate polyprenyltransferase